MRFAALALVLTLLAPAVAGDLPRAKPGEVGLSAERLAEIGPAIAKHVESGAIAGAVTVVARKGKVAHLEAHGAFAEDSLFRIYSMTKPVTVVAALSLVDEGKLALDDPVAKYLPELAKPTVHGRDGDVATMTVQHLMQHTAGMTYGYFGNTPVDRRYRAANVLDRTTSLAGMTTKLAGIPLLYEPGERFHYSVSIDVLGRVIEVAAKKPLDEVFVERIFGPLGMSDTAFAVPKEEAARFVPNFGSRGNVIDDPKTSDYRRQPGLLSGGGGLVSTARDYTVFALMLANGGEWDGQRILKRATVETMTTNQLPNELVPIRMGAGPMRGVGFGLGVSVRVAGSGSRTRVGEWGWGGAASTTFFVAPKEELVVLTFTQRMPMWQGVDQTVRPIAYGAIEKPEPEPEPAGTGGR